MFAASPAGCRVGSGIGIEEEGPRKFEEEMRMTMEQVNYLEIANSFWLWLATGVAVTVDLHDMFITSYS